MMPTFRQLALTMVVVLITGCLSTLAASADELSESMAPSDDPGLLESIPELADLQLPEDIVATPNGLPNGPLRDYGTPTDAPGKECPFVGNIPVSLPAAASPVGTSIPGLAGLNLDEPSVDTQLHAELCMSKEALADAQSGDPPPVLFLNHGITYGTWYWDFPHEPERYSTVNHLNQHGYATLNIDRLGAGRSDHPLSPLVNAQAQAEVVHQLVQKLKSGDIGDISFGNVGLVGHSYGTVINWLESAMYNDADVNIGTGYSSRINPVTAGSFIGLSTPALASPVQRGHPWAVDPGYLQPLPTARDLPQLYTENVDQEVVNKDIDLANTVTAGEVATFPVRGYDGTFKNIRVPTFSIQGERDIMTCGNDAQECATTATQADDPKTVEKASARYTEWQSTGMSSQSCFRGAAIPEAAHNVALHRNAKQFQRQVAYFADQAMGTQGENTDEYRESCMQEESGMSDVLPETNRLIPPFSPPPPESIIDPVFDLLPGN